MEFRDGNRLPSTRVSLENKLKFTTIPITNRTVANERMLFRNMQDMNAVLFTRTPSSKYIPQKLTERLLCTR